MPVFGNRMVVQTANYKHVQKVKEDMEKREEALGKWSEEKAARIERLRSMGIVRPRADSVASMGNTTLTDLSKVMGSSQSVGDVSSFGRVGSARNASSGSSRRKKKRSADVARSTPSLASSAYYVDGDDTKEIVGGGKKSLCGQCLVL